MRVYRKIGINEKIFQIFYFLFSIFFWFFLILIAPYLTYLGGVYESISYFIYYLFSFICHQQPSRSFFLFEYKFAVCARCTGIYLGALIAVIIYSLFKEIDETKTPSKWPLIISLIPIGIDGLGQLIGLWESNNFLRLITGFIFGFVVLFYLLPVYNEIVYEVYGLLKKYKKAKKIEREKKAKIFIIPNTVNK